MIPRALRYLGARFESGRVSTKVLVLTLFTSAVLLAVLTWRLNQAYSDLDRPMLLQTLQNDARSQASVMDSRLDAWLQLQAALARDPRLAAYLQDRSLAGPARAALDQAGRA